VADILKIKSVNLSPRTTKLQGMRPRYSNGRRPTITQAEKLIESIHSLYEVFSTENIPMKKTQEPTSIGYGYDTTISGNKYSFHAELSLKGGTLTIDFERNKRISQTGDISVPEILKALSIVGSMITQIIKEQGSTVRKILFAAIKAEKSRNKLYTSLTHRLAQRFGGTPFSKEGLGSYNYYGIIL
jgi:hypothetical protein